VCVIIILFLLSRDAFETWLDLFLVGEGKGRGLFHWLCFVGVPRGLLVVGVEEPFPGMDLSMLGRVVPDKLDVILCPIRDGTGGVVLFFEFHLVIDGKVGGVIGLVIDTEVNVAVGFGLSRCANGAIIRGLYVIVSKWNILTIVLG